MTMAIMKMKTPSTIKGTQCRLLRPSSRQEVREAQFQEREAALIVDVNGKIICCSPTTAAMLGQPPEALVSQPVTKVLPNLPMSASTLGYNLAYAVIRGARGEWTEHIAQAANGEQIHLEVLFTCRKVSNNFIFELIFRLKAMQFQSMAQACVV